jgi:hypothetical protein
MKPALVLVPLALVAACSSSGASGLSKSAYVQKAEALCAKANTDIDALTTPTDPAGLPAYVQSVVDIAANATTALGKLDAPSKDKAELDSKMLAPLRAQVSEGRGLVTKVRAAVASGDQKALGELVASPPTMTKADLAWMRAYGFKACVTAADTEGR